jgi:hypothetical protein
MQTELAAAVQSLASVFGDEVTELVNENEKWRSLLRPAAESSRHQFVHDQRSQ